MAPTRPSRAGFSLIELLVIIAIIGLLLVLLLPGLAGARRSGRLAVCFSNLGQFARATPVYANDSRDGIWAFSWKAGATPSQYPDLQNASSDVQAAAFQAVDILRRRGDRPEIPAIQSWIPNILYSHLVLTDYLSTMLPEPIAACPEDRNLLQWRSDPRGFDQGQFRPSPAPGGGPSAASRYPYSSSYQVPDCTFDASPVGHRVMQAAIQCDGRITPVGHQLGGLKLTMVQYPSQKAHVYDRHERHFSPRQPFFGLAGCRQPILTFDGAVVIRSTADANPGWQPNDPTSPLPTIVQYYANPWDPPTVTHQSTDQGIGVYRWTRGGLSGIDFRGSEINTGQPLP
jgi:type II secretory pathway pseudopilin PulG